MVSWGKAFKVESDLERSNELCSPIVGLLSQMFDDWIKEQPHEQKIDPKIADVVAAGDKRREAVKGDFQRMD